MAIAWVLEKLTDVPMIFGLELIEMMVLLTDTDWELAAN